MKSHPYTLADNYNFEHTPQFVSWGRSQQGQLSSSCSTTTEAHSYRKMLHHLRSKISLKVYLAMGCIKALTNQLTKPSIVDLHGNNKFRIGKSFGASIIISYNSKLSISIGNVPVKYRQQVLFVDFQIVIY